MQPTIERVYDIYRTYLDQSSKEFETDYLCTVSTREAAENLVLKFFEIYADDHTSQFEIKEVWRKYFHE
jgi:hypothetical protein